MSKYVSFIFADPRVMSKWIQNQNKQAVFTCHLEFRVLLPNDRIAQTRAVRSLPATNVVQLNDTMVRGPPASAAAPMSAESTSVTASPRLLVSRVLEHWPTERAKLASLLPTPQEILRRMRHTPHLCAWIVEDSPATRNPQPPPPEEADWAAREKRAVAATASPAAQRKNKGDADPSIEDMPDIVSGAIV